MSDYTGSFSGSFSGSFLGSGASLTNINFNTLANKPTTIQPFEKNSILANNAFRTNFNTNVKTRLDAENVISSSAQLTTEFDTRYGNELGDGLISGSSQINYSQLSGIPSGILSSSAQVNANTIANFDSNVKDKLNAEGIYTSSAQIIAQFPSGVVSGSSQIPVSYISASAAASGFTRDNQTLSFNQVSKVLTISNGNTADLSTLAGGGGGGGSSIWSTGSDYYHVSANLKVTGSLGISGIPNVSASIAQAIAGGGGSSDVSALNTFTGSIQTQLNNANSVTGSYLTSLPSGVISGSSQLPSGLVSGSAQSRTHITSADLDMGGRKVLFGNVYSSLSDLPNASTYHGMFAHVHAEGKGYFAHGGQWIELTNASTLNSFTSSINTKVNSLTSATSSYLTSVPSGTVSGSAQITAVVTNTYISASAAASGFGSGGGSSATASFVEGVTNFNGNRIVSNTDLPNNIYNVNFGTSGSVSNFIEKVFFPNTVPVISTTGFTIGEFVVSGSSVGTVSATDAEGQSFTYRTASSYTADFFRISSAGAITLNTKSTSSMNTDNTPGSGSHPFLVEAVDTFSGVGSKTIYIRVTPNTAPKWRQTSTGGSVVTRFTQSLNENSPAANNKVRIYFTDDESDTITIGSGSNVPAGFTFTKASTYVQLNQTTASLDYETTPKYELVLTASDEHYVSGDDIESIAYLPFQIAVVDNVGPSVNDQTLSSINENSSNGTTVATITATDPEGDTVIFSNFTLKEAKLNAGSNITSSLGGNSLYDPHSDPFQCSVGGVVTRKNGVYLNSDVANRYIYQVTVKDALNNTTDTGLITIPISDDASSAISDNWSNLYVIESAVSGNEIKIGSNGRTGTSGQWSSAASQRWSISSTNNLISLSSTTGSSTTLRLASNLSGSAITSGGTISVALTASEHGFETTKQFVDVDISVTSNSAPSGSYTHTTSNLNTNLGRSGSLLTTLAWTDTESDTIQHGSFVFTDASGQLNAVRSGDNYLIQAKNNLSGSNVYHITGSINDEHKFGTGTAQQKFTITQSPNGTLGGDTTSYIIESALSGSVIRDASGFGAGNASQVTVSYSPSHGSPSVASFTSSHPAVSINSSGNLSMALPVSGSPSSSGDTFVSTIGFTDQYGNSGTGTVTVNVFANLAPSLSFSDVAANLTASISPNTNLVNLTISDTESDTPFSASIADSGATSLKLVPQNANSSSYQIQSKGTISSGTTLQYDVTVTDNFGKSTTVNNRTVNIKDPVAKTYVYGWDGGSAATEAQAIASMGDSGGDGVGITSGSVIAMLQSGSLGSTFSPSYVGGTMTKVYEGNKATLSDTAGTGLSSFGYVNFSSTSQRLIVVFPSASNQAGKPKSMYDGVPPDSTGTAKEYYVYAKDASIPGTIGTGVYYFETENAVEGYSNWGMVFAEGENTNNSRYYLMPDSASAP